MSGTTTKKEASIAEKLDALYELQKIDSEIDRIRTVRGELPLEVQDLEDEIEGLSHRISRTQEEAKEMDTEVSDRKNAVKEAELLIAKYKEQQGKVRNNREFESLAKEIEFQELEIKLHEKKSKEVKFKITGKKEALDELKSKVEARKADLAIKKAELDEIVSETQKDEDKLMEKSEKAKGQIDERLVSAYTRLRSNAKNGLAVVPVERDCCGGCFNMIPPQRQLEIASKRKIIVCEHCGRVLVPSTEE